MKKLYGLFSAMLMMLLLGVNISSAVDITVGTLGTTASSVYPYSGSYGGTKSQMIFTATELTAAGAIPGKYQQHSFLSHSCGLGCYALYSLIETEYPSQ